MIAMPRAGWSKAGSDLRLSDLVSVGLLTRVFPADLVDEVIATLGRTEERRRVLPARLMAYFAIGMALYSEDSYEDVLAHVTNGLSWASGFKDSYSPPSKSAIFQARSRLGSAPVAALFERVAKPIGAAQAPGISLAGRRLVAIDGTCIDIADTAANADYFGRPGTSKAGFLQARVVALAECGTRALFAARVGAFSQSTTILARALLGRLEPGMLLVADRGFFSYALWRRAIARGADVLWRGRSGTSAPKPIHVDDLPDGSWLAEVRALNPAVDRRRDPMLVRIVDCTIDDGHDDPAVCQLFTTLLDADKVSAVDLAAAYCHRWQIAQTFDELQAHPAGPHTVLRSKSPDLVLQEIWGRLCCHVAIRRVMADGVAAATPAPAQVRRHR